MEALDIDEIVPDCQTESGCKIPTLSDQGKQVLELRDTLVRLKGLVESAVVIQAFGGIDKEQLELLALAEDEIRAHATDQSDED